MYGWGYVHGLQIMQTFLSLTRYSQSSHNGSFNPPTLYLLTTQQRARSFLSLPRLQTDTDKPSCRCHTVILPAVRKESCQSAWGKSQGLCLSYLKNSLGQARFLSKLFQVLGIWIVVNSKIRLHCPQLVVFERCPHALCFLIAGVLLVAVQVVPVVLIAAQS